MRNNILIIVGTRPEAVKMAPVCRARKAVLVNTAVAIAARATPEPRSLHARPFLAKGERRHVRVTAHRRENFGASRSAVARAMRELANHEDTAVIVPVHPDTAAREVLSSTLAQQSNVQFVQPLDSEEMIHVRRGARLILNESGGLQKALPAFGVPVPVLRNDRKRTVGVVAGCSQPVGTDQTTVSDAFAQLMDPLGLRRRMSGVRNPYGDGRIAVQIAGIIVGQRAA